MKTLIGVISCHSRPEFSDTVRNTWASLVPPGIDLRFFLGKGPKEPLQDEVILDCDDSYDSLPEKVQSMVCWAYEHGYDHVMKLDDDTVLLPGLWARSCYELYDFVGNSNPSDSKVPYGFAYVLNRRAMEIVVKSELPKDGNDEAWVSQVLADKGINLHSDPRYFLHWGRKPQTIREPSPRPFRTLDSPMEKEAPNGTFAWCIHLCWLGLHNTPPDVTIKEFRRVWERACHY